MSVRLWHWTNKIWPSGLSRIRLKLRFSLLLSQWLQTVCPLPKFVIKYNLREEQYWKSFLNQPYLWRKVFYSHWHATGSANVTDSLWCSIKFFQYFLPWSQKLRKVSIQVTVSVIHILQLGFLSRDVCSLITAELVMQKLKNTI